MWTAAARVSPAAPALRRAQRLRGSTGPDRAVSPTAVTHHLLLVTLRPGACPSQVPKHMWCCPQARVTILARAQPGPWSVHVPVRLRHSARSTCSKRNTSGPQSFPERLENHSPVAPLFPASSGYGATKMQVSSTVRRAASLLGMPADRSASPLQAPMVSMC